MIGLDRFKLALFAPIATMATVSLLIAGCGGSGNSGSESASTPVQGGALQVSQTEEVVTLVPLESQDTSSIDVVSQINEPLFKVNSEGKIEPWLLSRATQSPDGKVWTLTLRHGMKFSNGKAVTSADVLFTLEEARKNVYWSSLFDAVTSITAPSPSTIVIRNSKPAPELPGTLTQWSFGIVPKGYGGISVKEFAENPIGTGPFEIGQWKHGETLTLDKNPDYWRKGEPYLNKVVLHTISNPESRVAQLKGGQLDIVNSPPWSQIEALESAPEVQVGDYPMGNAFSLFVNTRVPLFQNPKAREAAYLAIDREGIVQAVLNGNGEPGASWIPPAVPFHNTNLSAARQDIPKAKKLLEEAVAEGVSPKFDLLVQNENPFWGQAAQIIEQNLDEAGFDVTLQPVEEAVSVELAASGKFDVATFQNFTTVPSPNELVGFYNGNEGAFTGAKTDQTTKLTEEALEATDEDRRKSLWFQIQELIDKEHAVFPVAYAPYSWATRDNVHGFEVPTTGIPWFAEAWLDG